MSRRPLAVALVATALLLLAGLAGGASAATPFTVGQGSNPRIAVSPNGTAHVVWAIPNRAGVPAAVGYCRIPAGTSACDKVYTLAFGGPAAQSGGNVTVSAESDVRIRIASSCYLCTPSAGAVDGVVRWTSNDGGASTPTVDVPTPLGQTPTTSGMGPDGISVIEGADNEYVTNEGGDKIMARPVGTGEIAPVTGFLFVDAPSLVQVPGTKKLVYAVGDGAVVKYAVYKGPTLGGANLMTQSNWITDQTLPSPEGDNGDTRLNAGPSGVYLTYRNVTAPLDNHLALRRFDPVTDTFGAPRSLEAGRDAATGLDIDAGVDYPSSAQDGAGRVHAVWRSLYDTKRLRYTVSDPTGATFAEAADLAQGEEFINPEVAAGPNGKGWAVWQGIGDTPIRVVLIEPYRDPGLTPPAPGPTTPVPIATVPVGRTVTTTVPGGSVSFGVPKTCVQPGSTFKVRLTWKRKKRKGNLFVKVTRADFYIGTKVVKVDRKAPFTQTLTVTASAKRGSTIALRARAYIKVKRGKAPKKSIKATIKVCAA